ncbi:phosphotransferase [Xylanimonas oleitrophica]|uniref:Phosphotransferase n=1 Tax=Xylanimonas oleitrophica TaxID=2607479 RepID=A0A2W5WZJ8_9MICO|nr:aminoglycoside phosphotransferase family protein [Xylanimonas oleitrophica]PZR53826.1 phosphotransferase [Xylanimonas oleitrophica]
MRADLDVTAELAHALLVEQHPDLAHLPLRVAAHGWDNVMVRAGDDLVLRLPRRAAAAHLVEHERAALPRLVPFLATAAPGVSVPVPVRAGRPSPALGYPWTWSVTHWADGVAALATPVSRRSAWAAAFGTFLAALHRPVDGAPAPDNPLRGVPLDARPEARDPDVLAQRLELVPPALRGTAGQVWEAALSAAPWTGTPVWVHGDPHPGNVVVAPGSAGAPDRLAAVVDFGDVTSGDPASDLGALWLHFDAAGRAGCRAAIAAARGADWGAATWARARGWALVYATAMLSHPDEHPALVPVGEHGLAALLTDR